MTSDRNQDARARGPRIAAAWLGIAAFALAAAGCAMGGAGSAATRPRRRRRRRRRGAGHGPGHRDAGHPAWRGPGRRPGPHRVRVRQRHQRDVGMHRACAANWPPVAAPSAAHVAARRDRSARRDDPRGRDQPARSGRPPAVHVRRRHRPGQTNGQGKTLDGGLWTVASAAGAPVANANPPTAAPAAGRSQLLSLVRQAGWWPACRLGPPRPMSKEARMSRSHITRTTTLTPEQFIAGLTDFGPGRSKLFGNSSDEYLKVHDRGPDQADVTEGSAGIWERLHYDWSDPHRVVLTTTDSNVWGGGSGHTYTFTRQPNGTTDVDVVVVREGKNLMGRMIAIVWDLRQAHPGEGIRKDHQGDRSPESGPAPAPGCPRGSLSLRSSSEPGRRPPTSPAH